jgi:hypothetical protein
MMKERESERVKGGRHAGRGVRKRGKGKKK